MNEIELTPDPHLLESMRAVGYTVETAVADIIDNSVAAAASVIEVRLSASGPTRVSLLDDGVGMDRETALDAMRLAVRPPSDVRRPEDLGRFGLGLKTASLSQCRVLTVASKKDDEVTVLRWSLDHVADAGRWAVIEVDAEDRAKLLGWSSFESQPSGTLVAWEDMDLFGETEGSSQEDFDRAMVRVRSHCELVFHRFISGHEARKLQIRFNGTPISALDPFLTQSKASSSKSEKLRIGDSALAVTAHTLPHLNKMTAAQRKVAQAPGPLRDSQGFYIYRGGRLVIWGTWFRLNPKAELGKLARVQVDIPNSLDHLWALDIKKSQAVPPREIRDALRNLASKMIEPSKRVHAFRGRKVKGDDHLQRFWDVVTVREGEFRYEVNRQHDLMQRFAETLSAGQLTAFNDVLGLIENSFPVLDAHNRLSVDGTSVQAAEEAEVLLQARSLRGIFASSHPTEESFVDLLLTMEPFGSTMNFRDKYMSAYGEQGESND